MKAEEVHVKHEPVVISAMCSVVLRETAAYTGHVGVKMLHGFIQTVLGAAADHDIGMSQLLMITLQKLTNNYHNCRLNTHPPRGKGLKELGRRESVPTSDRAQDGGCCLISDSHGVVCGRAHPRLPALLPTGHIDNGPTWYLGRQSIEVTVDYGSKWDSGGYLLNEAG